MAEQTGRNRKTYGINFKLPSHIVDFFINLKLVMFLLSIFRLIYSYTFDVLFEVSANFYCDTTSTNSSVRTDKI